MDDYIFWFKSTHLPMDIAYKFADRGLSTTFFDKDGQAHTYPE